MRSIFDILHKNFQEDQLNSRRFPGFPGGFLNSSRFPGVVDTLLEPAGIFSFLHLGNFLSEDLITTTTR